MVKTPSRGVEAARYIIDADERVLGSSYAGDPGWLPTLPWFLRVLLGRDSSSDGSVSLALEAETVELARGLAEDIVRAAFPNEADVRASLIYDEEGNMAANFAQPS